MRIYGPLKNQKKRYSAQLTEGPQFKKKKIMASEVVALKLRLDAVGPLSLHTSDILSVALSKAHNILRVRKDIELKKRREQARLALIEVEKSVSFEDNLESMKELENLCGCQVGIGGVPLDWLGLSRKDDEEEEEIVSTGPLSLHNSDLKMRREQARLAIIEMEKSVVLEDKLDSFKELEKLCGYQVGIGGFVDAKWVLEDSHWTGWV